MWGGGRIVSHGVSQVPLILSITVLTISTLFLLNGHYNVNINRSWVQILVVDRLIFNQNYTVPDCEVINNFVCLDPRVI